jgi:hypothetical protein
VNRAYTGSDGASAINPVPRAAPASPVNRSRRSPSRSARTPLGNWNNAYVAHISVSANPTVDSLASKSTMTNGTTGLRRNRAPNCVKFPPATTANTVRRDSTLADTNDSSGPTCLNRPPWATLTATTEDGGVTRPTDNSVPFSHRTKVPSYVCLKYHQL